MYDTIIIGAGMSGLAAGIRLAHYDRRVCILERHTTIGGLNSFYRQRGRDYDVGLHAVTNYAPTGSKRGPLARLLRQLRFRWDDFAWRRKSARRSPFPASRCGSATTSACSSRKWPRSSPTRRTTCGSSSASWSTTTIWTASCSIGPRASSWPSTITDPLLREMLLCPLMWYGNAREHDMDFGQFCIMFRSIFLEGFARPLAGVRLILRNLVRRFRSLGGELRLRSGVERIQIEDGRAVGVVLDNGEQLEARNILSSAGIVETMRLSGETPEIGSAAGPDVVHRDHLRARPAAAASWATSRRSCSSTTGRRFTGSGPGRTVRRPVGRDLLAQQLPVRRGSAAGRRDAHDAPGRLRSLVPVARRRVSAGQTALVRPHAGQRRRASCPTIATT